MDYDIAVGVSGQTAMDIALREADRPTEPKPYGNDKKFALWCKTQLNGVHLSSACELATARMKGRVWAWVRATDELMRGDHIAWNSGVFYYYQHAIVTRIDGIVIIRDNRSSEVRWNASIHCVLWRLWDSLGCKYLRGHKLLTHLLTYLLTYLLSGAVYCNRSHLFFHCLFVCGSVTTITRNCVHRSSSNWVCR